MQKYPFLIPVITLFISSLLLSQVSLADTSMPMDDQSPSCKMIVKACLNAGFIGDPSSNKRFWFDCMKPILLGKQVKDVTVDPKDVSDCRQYKIKSFRQEMEELEKVPTT